MIFELRSCYIFHSNLWWNSDPSANHGATPSTPHISQNCTFIINYPTTTIAATTTMTTMMQFSCGTVFIIVVLIHWQLSWAVNNIKIPSRTTVLFKKSRFSLRLPSSATQRRARLRLMHESQLINRFSGYSRKENTGRPHAWGCLIIGGRCNVYCRRERVAALPPWLTGVMRPTTYITLY